MLARIGNQHLGHAQGGWASVSVSAPECSWCLPGFWTSQIQTGSIYTYLARVRLQTVPPRVAFKLSGPRAFRLQSLCTKQPAYACLLPSLLPAEDEGPPNPTCSHSGSGTRNPEMFLDAQPMFRCNMLLSTACAMTALRCLNAEFVFVREVQSGLCVEVSGSGDTDSPLRLLDCGFGVQNSKQVWYFRDGEFVSVWSQLCADVYSWGIGLWPCRSPADPSTSQVWQVNGGVVVNTYWGTCLTPPARGEILTVQDCQPQATQTWELVPACQQAHGAFSPCSSSRPGCRGNQFVEGGVCVDCPRGEFNANGQCATCPVHQYWSLSEMTCADCPEACVRKGRKSEVFFIRNTLSGLCLDISGRDPVQSYLNLALSRLRSGLELPRRSRSHHEREARDLHRAGWFGFGC